MTTKVRQTRLLIDGRFCDSTTGRMFPTINPATEEKIADVAEGDVADIDRAVRAARQAFEAGPWPKLSARDRGGLLYKLAGLVEQNLDELAVLETLDNGKPIRDSRSWDVPGCATVLRYYAGWADKIHGQTIPIPGEFFTYTKREPVGVCGQIIPWNFPLCMAAWKIGPALAAGCTVVLKPGDPFDPSTEQGPQVDDAQFQKILRYINLGREQGARCVTGGERAFARGYFVQPTVFSDVRDDMAIATDEIFGPVVSVLRFGDLDEVVERANHTFYGLSAGVWTRDIGKAHAIANRVKAGTVWVNCFNVVDPGAPFGGFKMSGIGRELGQQALDNYTETKTVTIRLTTCYDP